MIIVTSNLAIGDGTLAPATPPWLGTMPTAIHRAAIRAGIGEDGGYRSIDRLDVVVAGDTFDWLTSAEWLGDTKPWHASTRSSQALARVARRSVRLGRVILAPLVRWARHGLMVPAEMRGGRVRSTVLVPVHVTLLAGDRDARVEHVLGGRRPVTLGTWWDDGRVSIRHGHEFDPACRGSLTGARVSRERPPTLAESVAVDLVARFAAVAAADDAPCPRGLIRRLADAGVVGIPAAIAAWRRSAVAGIGRLGEAWRQCVDAWWHQARRCVPSCELEFDVVDALAVWLAQAMSDDVETCATAAGLRSLVAAPAPGGTGAVFGHLRGDGRAGSAPGLAGESALLLACGNATGWPRWRPIVPVDADAAVVSIRSPMAVSPADGLIVDAA